MNPTESPEWHIILQFQVGVVISDQTSTPISGEQHLNPLPDFSEAFKDQIDEQTGHNVMEVEKPNPLSMTASRFCPT